MVNLEDLLLRCYVAEQLEIEGLRSITYKELHPILDELQDLRIKCTKLQLQIDHKDSVDTMITSIEEIRNLQNLAQG